MHKLAAVFLAQLGLVVWLSRSEIVAPPSFPATDLPQWQRIREEPIAPEIRTTLGADVLFSRQYLQREDGHLASLMVAWFASQREGINQPHSPQVCLPGAGWVARDQRILTLETQDGPLRVNLYMVGKGDERAAVVYWYQGPSHASAGEWESKFWTLWDGLRLHRTDIALVRVMAFGYVGEEESAKRSALSLAQAAYSGLHLP